MKGDDRKKDVNVHKRNLGDRTIGYNSSLALLVDFTSVTNINNKNKRQRYNNKGKIMTDSYSY